MKRIFTAFFFVFSLFPLMLFAQQKKIALLEPRVGDGSTGVSGMEKAMVRGELRKAIVNHSGFEAFTRADVDKLIAEQDFQRTGMVSDDQRRRVGEMSGADYICVSTLTKSNTEFYLEAYLINVESGQISNPASQYGELLGGKLANMLNICQSLAQEMIGTVSALTVPRREVERPAPSPRPTPVPEGEHYDIYRTYNGFTILGDQRVDYTDNADALKILSDKIKEWGQCRTGAILENGKGVIVFGNNGYQYMGFSDDFDTVFKNRFRECYNRSDRFSDITINRSGHFVIVRNAYGFSSNGLPQAFLDELWNRYRDQDSIYSVSLDNNDNWAFVSKKVFQASNSGDNNVMKIAHEKFGTIYSVCITLKGIVVCCRNGVFFKGIPKNVADAILEFMEKKNGKHPKVIKYTDSGTYLITDGNSAYSYYM